jgi:hypothetical protein
MNLTGSSVNGWKVGELVTKWWRGKFVHLYRITKACAQCGREMDMAVTQAAIIGTAKNAGLHLSRCQDCRKTTKSTVAMSRPMVREGAPINTDASEVERLRAINSTMQQEIDCLNAYVRELEAKKPGPW